MFWVFVCFAVGMAAGQVLSNWLADRPQYLAQIRASVSSWCLRSWKK